MCSPNILFPVFMLASIFHCRSFSPCWPLAFLFFSPRLWISMFFFLRNSSPLFSITRSSSFSVIYVSVNIKNNAEKDTTFFLSKSPGGHVISFQIKPWVAFGLPYLLIELFYIGIPVVRTDGRSLARCTVTWLPNFLGWVDYHISLVVGLRPRAALRATREAPLKIQVRITYMPISTRNKSPVKNELYFREIGKQLRKDSCVSITVKPGQAFPSLTN